MNLWLKILVAMMALAIIGCGKNEGKAAVDYRNYSPVIETQDYPAVVKIHLPDKKSICSGTFISRRAVLTAAHCTLQDGTYTILSSFGTHTTNRRVSLGDGSINDTLDIAILILDRDVAEVSQNQVAYIGYAVKAGDTLRLIGYGCDNVMTQTGSGTKRTGTNQVSSIDGYVNFLTPGATTGRTLVGPSTMAGSCFGDSGGPAVMVDAKGRLAIVGVSHSSATWMGDQVSSYINLTRPEVITFLHNVAADHELDIDMP